MVERLKTKMFFLVSIFSAGTKDQFKEFCNWWQITKFFEMVVEGGTKKIVIRKIAQT